jgi:GT2 family glycosyltransferase
VKLELVSVVIPSWNGAEILKPTLEHLTRVEGVEFEVLVVDHGRLNRDTEYLMKGFPRFRYLGLDEQLGYAGAVNYGAERAAHALVAVICNDVLVEKEWLAELLRAYQKHAEMGAHPVVTSLVTRPGFEHALSARYNIWGRIVNTHITPTRPEDYVPFFPDGSAFLFNKAALGLPFDADYFLYQEDVSLGWRAWLMGEGVALAPLSKALNADGGTTRRTPYRAAYFTERNRWLNYLKFLSGGALLRLLPALLIDALLKLLFGSNRLAKLHAWAWLITHPVRVFAKRAGVQKMRRRGDEEVLRLVSGRYLDRESVLNKFFLLYFRLVGIKLGAGITHTA